VSAILEISHLSKTFPGQRALDDVSLSIEGGEVHALVGKNGSGKSTIAKVLSGFHAPDPGAHAVLGGEEVPIPFDARSRELLHFVHQDLGLVDSLNVLDNIGLSDGYRTHRGKRINWAHSRERAQAALAPFGLEHIDLDVPIREFSIGIRAIIAIARGLIGWHGKAGLLVLDETTAALPPHEVEVLVDAMRRVTERGSGILYITHRLDEVFQFTDRVSILRDGRLVDTCKTTEVSRQDLVAKMIGTIQPRQSDRPDVGMGVALRCIGLTGAGLKGIDFSVNNCEIVGVAGILGSGREALADAICGAIPLTGGQIQVGLRSTRQWSPHRALTGGIVLVPSDRKRRGILPQLSVRENMTLPRLRPLVRRGRINPAREDAEVRAWIDSVGLEPPEPERSLSTLSGGNQQKVILARALRMRPRVLVLDEATQGVDVGAKRAIHDLIRQVAGQGAGVIVCTAEPEDLPGLCHRVLVLSNGRIVETLTGEQITQEAIFISSSRGA
jgi:ribose transport system ATP-binding protein